MQNSISDTLLDCAVPWNLRQNSSTPFLAFLNSALPLNRKIAQFTLSPPPLCPHQPCHHITVDNSYDPPSFLHGIKTTEGEYGDRSPKRPPTGTSARETRTVRVSFCQFILVLHQRGFGEYGAGEYGAARSNHRSRPWGLLRSVPEKVPEKVRVPEKVPCSSRKCLTCPLARHTTWISCKGGVNAVWSQSDDAGGVTHKILERTFDELVGFPPFDQLIEEKCIRCPKPNRGETSSKVVRRP